MDRLVDEEMAQRLADGHTMESFVCNRCQKQQVLSLSTLCAMILHFGDMFGTKRFLVNFEVISRLKKLCFLVYLQFLK